MKKTLGLSIFFLSAFAFAQEQSATSTESIVETPKAWSVSANLETTEFNYKEPDVMTVTGRLNGVSGQVQYKSESAIWFQGNGTYLAGSAIYNGSLDNGTPSSSTDNFKVLDLSVRGLVLTDIAPTNQVSLYLGLGRRSTEDLDDVSPHDYYRRHIYNYFSLGTNIVVPHSEFSSSTLILGFDSMTSGTSESRLSDVSSIYPDFTVNFKGGNAFNIEWQYKETFDFGTLFAGLAYKKWTLNDSEIATVKVGSKTRYYIEPRNETATTAIKIGAQF